MYAPYSFVSSFASMPTSLRYFWTSCMEFHEDRRAVGGEAHGGGEAIGIAAAASSRLASADRTVVRRSVAELSRIHHSAARAGPVEDAHALPKTASMIAVRSIRDMPGTRTSPNSLHRRIESLITAVGYSTVFELGRFCLSVSLICTQSDAVDRAGEFPAEIVLCREERRDPEGVCPRPPSSRCGRCRGARRGK